MTTDLVEKCARALWQRERERATHCDDVLSSIKGQAIKPTMDPFDEHRDMWVGDALAVIDALADGVSDEMVEVFLKSIKLDQSINDAVAAKFMTSMQGKCRREEMKLIARDGIRSMFAAIRAAKSREG